jgi:hypothetical protein
MSRDHFSELSSLDQRAVPSEAMLDPSGLKKVAAGRCPGLAERNNQI